MDHLSLLSPYGYQSGSCGYCKDQSSSQRTPNSRGSYYANTSQLTPEHYQELVDRGWRRLPAAQFKPSKHQRQTLSKWNKFVLGSKYIEEAARLHPKTRQEKTRSRNDFNLITAVHEAEYGNVKTPPEPAHKFTVSLEPDDYSDEKYRLFEQYQRIVHHEGPSKISKSGFRRFLCSSPLQRSHNMPSPPPAAQSDARGSASASTAKPLGSYHQLYRLDGRLVALAVLDLLPHAVSAVYFIYDVSSDILASDPPLSPPEPLETATPAPKGIERFSPGKLSAIREAAFALEAGYEYYYMGYYIHNCGKMRYKGEFRPQHVLDPITNQWDPLDGEPLRLMDKRRFVSMSRERAAEKSDQATAVADKDEDEAILYPNPKKAADEDVSIFDLRIPGAMTVEELQASVDVDAITAGLGKREKLVAAPMAALSGWAEGSVRDGAGSIKGLVAELAALVGPKVANEMVVHFT